jgi:hypothetical protein
MSPLLKQLKSPANKTHTKTELIHFASSLVNFLQQAPELAQVILAWPELTKDKIQLIIEIVKSK